MNTPLNRRTIAVVGAGAIVVVALALVAWRHFAAGHRHEPGPAVLSLDDGKRWPTDEPLRAGMQEIRAAAVPVLAAFDRQTLTTDAAREFSDSVGRSFAKIAQTCKLAPKADATLHALIADLMQGAAGLAKDPKSPDGRAAVTRALDQYADHFDHPGWTRLGRSDT